MFFKLFTIYTQAHNISTDFLKCHLHPQQSNGLEFLFHYTHTASVTHLLTAYFIRAYSIWNLFPRNIPHTKSLLLIPLLVFVLMLILLTMKFPKIKSTLYLIMKINFFNFQFFKSHLIKYTHVHPFQYCQTH